MGSTVRISRVLVNAEPGSSISARVPSHRVGRKRAWRHPHEEEARAEGEPDPEPDIRVVAVPYVLVHFAFALPFLAVGGAALDDGQSLRDDDGQGGPYEQADGIDGDGARAELC
jgi:hypothetical protein